MKQPVLILSICFLAVLLFSIPAPAIMLGMSTEDLTKSSQTVIIGEVGDVVCQWSEDGKRIVTRATVEVDEVVKGNRNHSEIIVEYEGGEIGEIGLKVSDSPSLVSGENVILFLKEIGEARGASINNIVGKAQGKYSIGEDGIVRKTGFELLKGNNVIDNAISVDEIVGKIKAIK
jgi:hypothetical protein